jgi:uncharacterized protein Yka (UPF0111/DUF47 family)
MSAEKQPNADSRPLENIFREHLENSLVCSQTLHELFSHPDDQAQFIVRIKHLEEYGDRLTAEAYYALEGSDYSGLTHIIEELIKSLDDIVDGFNKTSRLIDIFQPIHIEEAAYDILSEQQAMIARLQQEIDLYPNNDLSTLRSCCNALKQKEESVDLIYHEWRKKERRVQELSIVEEYNWTELFGILEQTADDIYHAALELERIARYRSKGDLDIRNPL